MIRNLNPASEQFLSALSQMQHRLQLLQRQISSGVRIERASDAPDRVIDLISRQSDITQSEQVRANLGRLTAEVDVAEASMQRAVTILEEARAVGTQFLSANATGAERDQILAGQVAGLHEELVRLSAVTSEGRFVFGGDDDQQAPYQLNPGQPNGVDRLNTAAATRLVLDIDGSRFLARRTAQEIFDHREADDSLAADNAFAAVHSLRTSIESGDTTAAQAALDSLKEAHTYLNEQLFFYGNVQSRVAAAINQSHEMEARLKGEVSEIRDTDLAAAAVELSRIQTSIQAALQARANFTTPNLFDFLG